MIGIINYGAGNLHSVKKAIEFSGARTKFVTREKDIKGCGKLILPGVGAFGKAMQALDAMHLNESICKFIASNRPFLGICLGMQLLFENSEESPNILGLGILPGSVKKLPPAVKVPHLGWNQIDLLDKSPLWRGIPDHVFLYFAHSYFVEPLDKTIVSAKCHYGHPFAVAFARETIFAVQFHPEKSQKWGLKIMENFIHL